MQTGQQVLEKTAQRRTEKQGMRSILLSSLLVSLENWLQEGKRSCGWRVAFSKQLNIVRGTHTIITHIRKRRKRLMIRFAYLFSFFWHLHPRL